jgi:2-iminobutanoate/2-iminopropanoate deaminase
MIMAERKQCYGGALGLPLSAAVRAGDFVFVSGQLPLDQNGEIVTGGIEIQTRAALQRLRDALSQAGAEPTDVVKVTVWLSDARDFSGFNKVYREFFASEPPARSTVRCDLVLDARIEIEAIAFKPQV